MNPAEFPTATLAIKGRPFIVSQQGIWSRPETTKLGLQNRETMALNNNGEIYKNAIAVSKLLDHAAKEQGQESSVNAFWLDSKDEIPPQDYVCLKIPMMIQADHIPVLTILKMSPGSGKDFIKTISDDSIDSLEMREILGNILKLNKDQPINVDSIAAANLVTYKKSASRAAQVLREGMNIKEVYQRASNDIAVQRIPWTFRSDTPLAPPDNLLILHPYLNQLNNQQQNYRYRPL